MHRISLKDSRGKSNEVYVGRRTLTHKGHLLSNPYRIESRDTVGHKTAVEKYRLWLWTRMKDPRNPVWKALRALRPESVLVCHCRSNYDCHADVIIKAWQWAWAQGAIVPRSPWPRPTQQDPQRDPLFLITGKSQPYA